EFGVTYFKFNVTKEGIYRISYNTLNSLQGGDFIGAQHSKFNLFSMGLTVPIYIYDSNNNGLFDNTDEYIEFYGKPNDGSFDSRLYADPQRQQPNPYVSLFNDTAVYFLAVRTQMLGKRMFNVSNHLSSLTDK